MKLGIELYNIGNINGVFEIVSGVTSSSVNRLKKMQDHARNKDSKGTVFNDFQRCSKLCSTASNYSEFREVISNYSKHNCIPYPGIFLQDLTFIEDGNKTNDPNDEKFYNFNKFRLASNVIFKLLEFQKYTFVFERDDNIIEYIKTLEGPDESVTFELSLKAEPREKS